MLFFRRRHDEYWLVDCLGASCVYPEHNAYALDGSPFGETVREGTLLATAFMRAGGVGKSRFNGDHVFDPTEKVVPLSDNEKIVKQIYL